MCKANEKQVVSKTTNRLLLHTTAQLFPQRVYVPNYTCYPNIYLSNKMSPYIKDRKGKSITERVQEMQYKNHLRPSLEHVSLQQGSFREIRMVLRRTLFMQRGLRHQ